MADLLPLPNSLSAIHPELYHSDLELTINCDNIVGTVPSLRHFATLALYSLHLSPFSLFLILSTCVKATAGLDVHAEMLTKHSGPDGNEKSNVLLGNPTLPEDSAETAELLAQTSVLRRTLALLYPLNR